MALRDGTKQQGEQLTPYSFRHRYAKDIHANNMPIVNISEAMGHTIEVHHKNYGRFKPNAKADFMAAVKVLLINQASLDSRVLFTGHFTD